MHQNHLELMLKMQILRLTPTVSESLGLIFIIGVLISAPGDISVPPQGRQMLFLSLMA